LAIEKGNDRRVSGEDARKVLHMGLEKLLKETVDPSAIFVRTDSAGNLLTIDCIATGKPTRAPRKTKA
jgi:hypothetical protein